MEMLFGEHAAWFTVPAIVGTGVFIIRLALMGMGDMETDVATGDSHADPGEGFKILSIQAIAAFLMGFGWIGLACYRGADAVTPSMAALLGIGGGVLSVWVLGMLLRGVYNLQSSGNVPLSSLVGREGDVYVTVPPAGKGSGQVRVVVDKRERIVNAVSAGDAPLATGSRVKVAKVNDDNTITVIGA
jgi:hypothetical protein